MVDNESGIVEVSSRTVQGRFLLRPSPEVNERILGILGRAQAMYGVELFAFIFLSNHFHILMKVLSALLMAEFTGYVKARIAKELGPLQDWEGPMWGGRYHSMSLGDSDEAVYARFMYILRNSCKEGLVSSPLKWPGVSSANALYSGEMTLGGTRYDRTAECIARRRGENKLFPKKELVRLSPLPFLDGLAPSRQQAFMVEAVRQVERETRARHAEKGTRPLGIRKICAQHPHEKPSRLRSTPSPLFLAATREEFQKMRDARAATVAAYRLAVERTRRGEQNVRFPEGTFPPPPPFVTPTRAPPAPAPSLPA